MKVQLQRPARLEGVVTPPGDKSISHRAAILNAIATGEARVENYSPGGDCLSTVRCLRALGVPIRLEARDGQPPTLLVKGVGFDGLREPQGVLNAGNSGTTMRFLTGLLAAQPFFSVLTGDRSLRSRPMHREAVPLRLMGAQISGRKGGTRAPLAIQGASLRGIEYDMPEASAQLKTTLMLAGLFAEGETWLHQPAVSRDHTELLLTAMGAALVADGLTLRLKPGPLKAVDLAVPADLSSAAFWLVAAVCHPNARLTLQGIGANPTRGGILEVLSRMGAHLTLQNQRQSGGEPVADLVAESSELRGVQIAGDLIPLVIDELPVLALAACFAKGTTVIRDAQSLRVKETDRIQTTVQELARLGADIRELPDGMEIRGTGRLQGAAGRSHGDHRLAMTLGVAGLLAEGATVVQEAEAASVSYPSFWAHMGTLAPGMATSS